jgi:DNA-binding NarL/FixJ family response regulator
MREEEREAGAEQPDEQDLSHEPGLELAAARLHVPLVGSAAAADKTPVPRLLIVDDHPLTRDALSVLLVAHGFDVVGLAGDGEQAIEEAARLRPDLVLLDLSMPGLDGLSALPRLREAAPECEVVVLTASGTDENLLAAIRAGAAGFLLKTEPPERIAAFLDGVANGEAALSGAIARRLLDRVRSGGRGASVPDEIASVLSARELEVLLLLDDHLGTDEIATRLFISEHTVRSHVKSLLRKLGVSSRREALEQLTLARA